MSHNQVGFLLCMLTALFVGFVFGMIVVSFDSSRVKKEAIKRGFAEYVVNSDGLLTWQWKEPTP